MAYLAKTRTTKYVTDKYPEASELTIPPGSVTVEIDWWDSPVVGFSLMLRRVMTQANQRGQIVQRTIENWNYDGPLVGLHQVPVDMTREVWARVWLPGVNWRESLVLVEKSRTTYTYATEFSAGPMRSRTVTGGYVIYDQAAEPWSSSTPTADGGTAGEKLDSRGQKRPVGPTRKIPDTARTWRAAIGQSAVVEEREINQIALWVEPYEEVREEVEVDGQVLRHWRIRHDYLTGLTEVDGPHEELRPGITGELPVDVEPPTIAAESALNAGVRIEIRGGGATITQWIGGLAGPPAKQVTRLGPTMYSVYRRIEARGPRTHTGDPYTILTAPPAPPASWPRTTELGVEDLAGAPASAVPPAEPDAEPDVPVVDAPEAWTHIGDIPNATTVPEQEGYAVLYDRQVEDGWTYEYYALAKVGDVLSSESNHATVTYTGPRTYRSTVHVQVLPGQSDITIDITAPADPRMEMLGLAGADVGYGETRTYDPVPAILETATGDTIAIDGGDGYAADNPGAWQSGLITDAVDLGRAIGLRQCLRNADRDALVVTLGAPLLGIDRGQTISISDPAWTTFAGGVQVKSRTRTADARWVIEGFSVALTRRDEATFDASASISAEEML